MGGEKSSGLARRRGHNMGAVVDEGRKPSGTAALAPSGTAGPLGVSVGASEHVQRDGRRHASPAEAERGERGNGGEGHSSA